MALLAVAMVVTGAQPVQRQLVRFEAKGVLRIEPDAVRKITLGGGGRQAAVVRGGDGGWVLEGAPRSRVPRRPTSIPRSRC